MSTTIKCDDSKKQLRRQTHSEINEENQVPINIISWEIMCTCNEARKIIRFLNRCPCYAQTVFDKLNTTAKDKNIFHLKGKQEEGNKVNNKIQVTGARTSHIKVWK